MKTAMWINMEGTLNGMKNTSTIGVSD